MKWTGAFQSIAEVSELLGVPAHVLRFWETQYNQIKPIKKVAGRRYYRPEDVTLLTQIRDCLYKEGYTTKGVQKLLKSKTQMIEKKVSESGSTDFVEQMEEIRDFLAAHLD